MVKQRKTIDVHHSGLSGPIRVDKDDLDPAETAARILARRIYGKRGICRLWDLVEISPDGATATYKVFLGYYNGHNTDVTGANYYLYV